MSLVSFVRAQDRDYDLLKKAIKESLDLIHFDFRRKADKIVIKPNMCYYYHPSTGEVTDPWFVGALIDVLRDSFGEDSEIFVVESDASAMKCKYAFSALEYDKMTEEKNAKLVNLSETESEIVDIKVGNAELKIQLPKLFGEADLVVNVPKLKYMHGVKITCALKNMFGCIAYSRKLVYHKVINEAIVAINKLVETDLVVVDGLTVNGKYAKRLNLVMSSEDPVAVDVAASKLMGIAPKSVKQIVLASREKVGSADFSAVGDFSYFKSVFPKKDLKDNLRDTAASVYFRMFG